MLKTVRSIRQQIVDELRSDVLSGRLEPGARLSEQELAKRFGVSRGPIREALSQLSFEALLISKPNCGVTVAGPPSREVRELITPIRRAVESYALKACFEDLTPRDFLVWEEIILKMDLASREGDEKELVSLNLLFHRVLVERAGQPELLTIWLALVSQIRGHFSEKILKYLDQPTIVGDHHRKLISAFRTGKLRTALAELKRHIS